MEIKIIIINTEMKQHKKLANQYHRTDSQNKMAKTARIFVIEIYQNFHVTNLINYFSSKI